MKTNLKREDIELIVVLVVGISVWVAINIFIIIDKVWTW